MDEDSVQEYATNVLTSIRDYESVASKFYSDIVGEGILEMGTFIAILALGLFDTNIRIELIGFAISFGFILLRSYWSWKSLQSETKKLTDSLYTMETELDDLLIDLNNLQTLRAKSEAGHYRAPSLMSDPSERSLGSEPMNPEYEMSSHTWLNYFHGCAEGFETSIHYTNLTSEEKGTFESLKQTFFKEYEQSTTIDKKAIHTIPDDFTILRYLQADKYDMKLALTRLLKSVEWRQEIDLYSMVSTPMTKLEIYKQVRVRAYMGNAKDNTPVFVERLGYFMSSIGKGNAKTITDDDYFECYIRTMGQFIQQFNLQRRSNPNAGWKQMFIGDLKGVTLSGAYRSVGLIKKLAKEVEIHFPEMAAEPIFLINCPTLVTGAYKMVRPFLDPVIVAKIRISSGVNKEELLEFIDESVLFEEYGGKNTGEFPAWNNT